MEAEEKITKVMGTYKFTNEENRQNGVDLARKLEEQEKIELDFARIKSDFKARLDAVHSEIVSLRNKVQSGEEQRDYECRLELDDDQKERHYIDIHTGILIRAELFHPEDYQREIPI
jgi:hypothetical protein